jgi:F-type H+-transporting ATPase subunit b
MRSLRHLIAFIGIIAVAGLLVSVSASPAFAAEGGGDLLSPNAGLMFWTLIIFIVLLVVLSKFAFGPITAAVVAREKALEEAISAAKADREESARLLAEQRAAIEAARTDAQKIIAEGRQAGERVRNEMIESTRAEQQQMLERARREIQTERDAAIMELRREAVDLAIAGASKVVERNLDSESNRKLVESFLASIEPSQLKS